MRLTLAGDLASVLLDGRGGFVVAERVRAGCVIAGAVLLDLVSMDTITIGALERSHGDPVILVRRSIEDDELLRTFDGASVRRSVDRLANPPSAVMELLEREGVAVMSTTKRILGFTRTRWFPRDPAQTDRVRSRLSDVLLHGRTPSARDAVLVESLHVIGTVESAVPESPSPRFARERAAHIAATRRPAAGGADAVIAEAVRQVLIDESRPRLGGAAPSAGI